MKTKQKKIKGNAILKVVNIKSFVVFLCFVFVGIFLCGAIFQIKQVGTPKCEYKVVIDAGHGGQDGGSVGLTYGTIEKEINLKYAFCLDELFKQYGFCVVLTRNTNSGLYSENAQNKKRDDMQKRKQIIENAKADFVISVHMNSYPSKSCSGAEVYYCENKESSKKLADCIQSYFYKNLPNAKSASKPEEFFILQQVDCPSVLIECGFISNPEEEKLLNTKSYMQKVCYNVLLGVLSYLT